MWTKICDNVLSIYSAKYNLLIVLQGRLENFHLPSYQNIKIATEYQLSVQRSDETEQYHGQTS